MFRNGMRALAACATLALGLSASAQTLQPFHKFTFEGDLRADQGTGGARLMPEGMPFQATDRNGREFASLDVSRASAFIEDGQAFQGSFTFMMWYRAEGDQAAPYAGFWGIAARPNSRVPEYGAHSAFNFDQMEFEGGGRKLIATNTPLVDKKWQRITCVQDTAAKTRTIYHNGVALGGDQSANYSFFPPALDAKVIFGRNPNAPMNQRLYGRIDEVTIFDRALTAAQIDSSYRAEADLEAPPAPAFRDAIYRNDQVIIRWLQSVDNRAVERYVVSQDGTELGEADDFSRQWAIGKPDIMPGEQVTIDVVAVDYSGNVSPTATFTYTHPGGSSNVHSAFAKTSPRLAPNPVAAGQDIDVDLQSAAGTGTLRVFDAQGRQMARQTLSGQTSATVSTVDWAAGTYYIEVRTTSEAHRLRAVVE